MKYILATLFLILLFSSCTKSVELIDIERNLRTWAKTAKWEKNESSSNSVMTSKGSITVSTNTLVLEKDGNYTAKSPTLQKGTFMVGPSMKRVIGINNLIREVKRCYKEENLEPIKVTIEAVK